MPKKRHNCVIYWETLSALRDDGLAELVCQHHAEVGVHKKLMPLACDWEQYHALEDKGILRILGARIDDKLVGYNSFMVMPHLHYAGTMHAVGDAIFVLKRLRHTGIGIELIDKAERDLSAEFSPAHVRIIYHDKTFLNLLAPVLKKRGYTHQEDIWDKMAGGG